MRPAVVCSCFEKQTNKQKIVQKIRLVELQPCNRLTFAISTSLPRTSRFINQTVTFRREIPVSLQKYTNYSRHLGPCQIELMEPLNFLTTEELLFFLHRKKTEISCIEQPHRLLTQLRDHDLVPEKLFENVKKMRSREQKEKGIYEVLDWVEKNKPQYMHQFWRCVFEDHILQLYPTLRMLRKNLLDGTFKFDEKHPDVETPAEEEKSEGKAEKVKEKNYKRKRSKDDRSSEDSDDLGSSSASTPSQKEPASLVKKGDKQEIWKWPVYETHLPVTCGDKEGTLYRVKMPRGEKCILSQGRWFTLNDFERFAGKEKCKNWKLSIRCGNTPLKKLIEEEHLQCPPMERRKRTCVQKNMNKLFPVSSSESSSEDSETSSSSVEESDAENFQEQGWRGGRTEIRGRVEEEEEDVADLSVFQAHSLPVTCVSLTGTLYKYRFATGIRGKCIRTEEKWFTPEEFVKQEPTLTDGHWKKDVLCHEKMLNFLIKMVQNNDDECYVCHSRGDLVCCDECPRAFHSQCHLPAVHGDSPGEWICTFCVLRTSQQWRVSSNMSEQEALDAPVSQYRLHCHYLLLCVYREDIQKVFVEDPRQTVPRYSEFISQPMWLDRIKQKLESGEYQTVRAFVSDFQLIFSNCRTFNRDNVFGRMGPWLKKMFEEEFKKIFSIQ
uniref:Nuclear body protein SP140-like protein n=1 Tax=Cyprinus carpio TaxID=7962 RepID=A0A8C1PEP3_CYPCA